MAYFLFLDESGHDLGASPYEVLAGISVEDRDLWNLIEAIKDAEERCFGLRYSRKKEEVKGKKFLKRKVFRHASQASPIAEDDRRVLAKRAIENGAAVGGQQLTALAQAKLDFVREVFDLCGRFHCQAFASIVKPEAPRPMRTVLRKDYAFLFERFFYFLEDRGPTVQGVIVFDELEKTQSKILIQQMEEYFLYTNRGKLRSRQVVPQPFFVHSDLTTLTQVADLIAYVTAWGFRAAAGLDAPARDELKPFVDQVAALRYRTVREILGTPNFVVWSFAAIDDLRGWEDKVQDGTKGKRQ